MQNVKFYLVVQKVFDSIRDYVDQVALRAKASHYQYNYRLKILDAEIINAHTGWPGGKITVYKGHLIVTDYYRVKGDEFLSLEDKVAAVFAHEIAHNCLGHIHFPILPFFFLVLATCIWVYYEGINLSLRDSVISGITSLVSRYLIRPYFQRKDELQADAFAAELLFQAGYDIRSIQYARQKNIELAKEDETGTWKKITASHLSEQERLDAVTKLSKATLKVWSL